MVKTWSAVPGDKEGEVPPPTHPCMLEASPSPPRVLSSVTFGQMCHLSLALRHLARDCLSCAPAIPGSQAPCSQDHRAGGEVGSGSGARLHPKPCSAHSTSPEGLGHCRLYGAPRQVCVDLRRVLKMLELFAYKPLSPKEGILILASGKHWEIWWQRMRPFVLVQFIEPCVVLSILYVLSYSVPTTAWCTRTIMIPILQIWKLRHGKIKELAQVFTVNEWQRQAVNPGRQVLAPWVLTVRLHCLDPQDWGQLGPSGCSLRQGMCLSGWAQCFLRFLACVACSTSNLSKAALERMRAWILSSSGLSLPSGCELGEFFKTPSLGHFHVHSSYFFLLTF